MSKTYYVYILASKKNGTIYIGVTSDLMKRVYEHKMEFIGGFTKRYNVNKLVHFEETGDVDAALRREKQLKKWKRDWKIHLIEQYNPSWRDITEDWLG